MPNPQPVPGRRVIVSGKRSAVPVTVPSHSPQIAALILDDGTVRRILSNDKLVTANPFLAPYAAKLREQTATHKTRGCGGCGGQPMYVQGSDIGYNVVRHYIANAGVDKQDQIKQALNVKQLRVFYLDASGNKARATV